MNNVDVVYTPWHNLKKTASMDVGQVGFHNSKMVSFLIATWSNIVSLICTILLWISSMWVMDPCMMLVTCLGSHCESGEANK